MDVTAGPGSAAAGAARGAEPTGSAVRLSLGFAAANMGSFDWDLVTDRLEWDDRLHALFGYTAESFAPHIDSFRARVHPEDRARER
jgi:PAS domain-containing protein